MMELRDIGIAVDYGDFYSGGRFYVSGLDKEDRHAAKDAGMKWCPDRRHWYTGNLNIVRQFVKNCGDSLNASVKIKDSAKAAEENLIAKIAANAKAAEEQLAAKKEQLAAKIAASSKTTSDMIVPAPPGLEYLPYQRAGIEYASKRKNTLIADEMGLGKTIQALGVINADENCKKVLIVCPASLKLNWQREARKWLARDMSVGIATTKKPDFDKDVVIINYEQVKKLRPEIDRQQWNMIVCDESHMLKNPKAQRTIAVLGGWDSYPISAERRIFMTGTPILGKPIDLWPIVQAADRDNLGRNWISYVKRYCDGYQNKYGWEVSGASNLSELQSRLRESFMVRRLKADVLTELPPKRRSVLALDPAEDADARKAVAAEQVAIAKTEAVLQRHEARKMVAHLLADTQAWEKEMEGFRGSSSAAFAEIASMRRETAVAKAPMVAELIADQEPEKLVVMVWHKEVAQIIADHLAAQKEIGADGVVQFNGDMSLEARQQSVDRFQSRDDCKIFVGTIAAASTGITLTKASQMIFAELDWSPGLLSQAEDRIHRIGQTDSVSITHVVLAGSIDERIADAIINKQAIIKAALDRPDVGEQAADVGMYKSLLKEARSVLADLTPEQVAEQAQGAKNLTAQERAALARIGKGQGFDAELARALGDLPGERAAVVGRALIERVEKGVEPKPLPTLKPPGSPEPEPEPRAQQPAEPSMAVEVQVRLQSEAPQVQAAQESHAPQPQPVLNTRQQMGIGI